MDADLSVHYLNLLLEINSFQLNKVHLPNPFHRTCALLPNPFDRTHIFTTWSQNPLYQYVLTANDNDFLLLITKLLALELFMVYGVLSLF